MNRYGIELKEPVYTNPLSCPEDISDFVLEGKAVTGFPRGRLRL